MLIFTLALRNIFRHPRKTILLASLIAVGMALLFVANAVFEGTSRGLRTSYIGSLTGDFVLAAPSEELFGLFGSEVPIVSDYETIPPLTDYAQISAMLQGDPAVSAYTPIVSAAASIRIGRFTTNVPVFGIEPDSYFAVCSDISIVEGNTGKLAKGGVFLNESLAVQAERKLKRPLKLGERILFSTYSGGSFRIRRGFFAGVHRYAAPNEALDRIVLADPVIVRSLSNYTLGFASKTDVTDPAVRGLTDTQTDMDSLFSDTEDIVAESATSLSLTDVEDTLKDVRLRDTLIQTDDAAWSFVLVKTVDEVEPSVMRARFDKAAQQNEADVRVLDWRTAAGSSATLLFAIRSAFYVGVAFLVLGTALVVMNALVISVLERTEEIGSMRALGAPKSFIRSLFILETLLLTIAAALAGILVGAATAAFLSARGIPLVNPILVSLFGGTVLRPIPTFDSALAHLTAAFFVGSVAWIYPVFLALRIQPLTAMSER